jgi:hypothetical protein
MSVAGIQYRASEVTYILGVLCELEISVTEKVDQLSYLPHPERADHRLTLLI